MMNYICEHCGAYLDPGEKCDCMDEKKQREERLFAMMQEGADGQILFNLEVMQYAGN